MSLERLIAPLTAEAFTRDYWEKASLVSKGAADRFSGLFSTRDLGRVLHYYKPKPPEGMMLVKGSSHYPKRWTHADGAPHVKHVREAMTEGYSVIINGINRMWEPIDRFCHELQADLHHPVDVNLYVTPPGTQAFDYHWDVMDVFVVQVEGRKRWQVYEAAIDRPFSDEHKAVSPDKLPPMVFERDLEAGEVLYIPRGHVHAARTEETTSVHLSIGVHPKTWIDLMAAAVNAARSDPRFRGALPPGYFTSGDPEAQFADMAAALPGLMDAESAIGHLAQSVFVDRPPPPGDDYLDAEPELGPDTRIERRPGVICRMLDGTGFAGVLYSGGKIIGPAKIGPALQRALDAPSVTLAQMEDPLSDREVAVLVRRLIRDGLLRVALDD